MVKAAKILTAEEVRKALDLDFDEMSDEDALGYSQRASDLILQRTGKDWGDDEGLAKQCAEFIVIDWYSRSTDLQQTIDWLLADLQDRGNGK